MKKTKDSCLLKKVSENAAWKACTGQNQEGCTWSFLGQTAQLCRYLAEDFSAPDTAEAGMKCPDLIKHQRQVEKEDCQSAEAWRNLGRILSKRETVSVDCDKVKVKKYPPYRLYDWLDQANKEIGGIGHGDSSLVNKGVDDAEVIYNQCNPLEKGSR